VYGSCWKGELQNVSVECRRIEVTAAIAGWRARVGMTVK
jgi:hypothetical protein